MTTLLPRFVILLVTASSIRIYDPSYVLITRPMHPQAIIDGASISLPHGTLTECYDELGSRYQLPVYCLSSPTNLVRENSDGDDENGDGDVNGDGEKSQEDCGVELPLKLRLSTGEEVKVSTLMLSYVSIYSVYSHCTIKYKPMARM